MFNEVQESYVKWGTKFGLLAGICFFIWIVTLFMMPLDYSTLRISSQNSSSLLNSFWPFFIHQASFIVGSLLMLPLVNLFYVLARDKNKGLVGFVSILGLVGFVFNAFGRLALLVMMSQLFFYPEIFMYSEDAVIFNAQYFAFDFGLFGLLLTGFWFFVNSYLAFNNNKLPKVLVIMGFCIGLNSLGMIYTQNANLATVSQVLFTSYTVFLLIWLFWESSFLQSLTKAQNKGKDALSEELKTLN